jgi:hypothetical protein
MALTLLDRVLGYFTLSSSSSLLTLIAIWTKHFQYHYSVPVTPFLTVLKSGNPSR